jgi:ABC-type glycerol-3-phosphate transport system substrate-binding protein
MPSSLPNLAKVQGAPRQRRWAAWVARWIAGLVGASLIACAASAPAPPSTPTASPSAAALPTLSARATTTRVSPTRAPITTTRALTLTVWTTEDLAASASPAGRVLSSQSDAFTAANPNLRVQVVLKKPSGKGGLLDFLLTTHAVVPALLPDLITLDLTEVPLAGDVGALQPLNGWLPAELNDDFFPFAAQAAHYQNQWLAVPFSADVQHLVYNKTALKKPPQTWDDFLKQKTPLLLPLGGDDAFLAQYVALAPLSTAAPLDWTTTTLVLNFFKRAHDLGLLNDAGLNLKNADAAWAPFAAAQVAMAQVAASRYLAERARLPNALYAPLPTRDGKTATLASGWAFAITTTDPTRQAAAARFVQWLAQGEHLAPWLRAAHRLPATRSALPLTIDPPEYAAFLRDELEHATYASGAAYSAKASDAWRAGIANVWKGQATPEDAARAIVAASK